MPDPSPQDPTVFVDENIESALERFQKGAPAEPEEVVEPVKPAEKPAEATAPKPEDKPADKPVEAAAPATEKPVEKSGETPSTEVPAAEQWVDPAPDIQLGAHAKPKTTESFTLLKKRLSEETKKRDDIIAAHTKELEELRAKPAVDPTIESELAELRAFRESVALEGDPVFEKKFDAPMAKISEDICAKLKEAGMSDADIAEVKKIGVARLDWAEVFSGLPKVKFFVERKLGELDALTDARKQAVTDAKSNLTKAIEQRKELRAIESQEITGKATEQYTALTAGVELLRKQPISPTDTPERKAAIQASNALIDAAHAEGRATLAKLGTPEGNAEAAAVVSLAWVFRNERDTLAKRLQSTAGETKTLQTQIAKLTADLAAANDVVAKFRKSGSLPATTAAKPAAPSGESRMFETAASALERFKNGDV